MKIVDCSNFDDPIYVERFVAENIDSESIAYCMCEALNKKFSSGISSSYYRVVQDDYVLHRGMADLV